MENNVKTFRYTYILKNLGVVYLLFLLLDVWLTFSFDGPIIFLFILFGVGAFAIILYITTSVTISNEDILGRTILGEKALKWSEIDEIYSNSSFFKLKNRDGDITLRVNSRLDGYVKIFDLLYQKRADLFEYERYNPLSRSINSNIAAVTLPLLLLVITIIYFVFSRKGDLSLNIMYIVIGVVSIYSLVSWFFSPQGMTIKSNSLTVKFLYKTDSLSIDDIVSIKARRGRGTIDLKNKRKLTFSWSGFGKSPYLVYYVILLWYQAYVEKQSKPQA